MTPPVSYGVEHGAGDGCAVDASRGASTVPGYLCQVTGEPHTAATFDWRAYLADALGTADANKQRALLDLPRVRRALTKPDPLLFALIYFPHHLMNREGEITFSDAHLGWAREAHRWLQPVAEPRGYRRAEFAPRETGKTTWWFLIIPAWAGAHWHVRFIAAFADTYDQSVGHLRTFRGEQLNNAMLRKDYGGFVNTTRNTQMRDMLVDNESMVITASGFVFAARGADTSSLGLKVGEKRPDLIILDDIEPHEGKYSLQSVKKRGQTLTEAILPLNEFARVMWVGTTTRHGGLAHKLVELADGTIERDRDNEWVFTENFRAHRWDPIITQDDGTERSLWPSKWTLDYLRSIAHTRSYAKNFANQPVNEDGDYWSKEDITYATGDPGTRKTVLVLDPNVNDRGESSDWTGICVAGLVQSANRDAAPDKTVVIKTIEQVRKSGRALKDHALTVLARFPDIRRVVIECNQGYLTWLDIFADFPVPVDLVVADFPKPVRAALALNHYQARPTRVVHLRRFVAAESQMFSFPNVTHDDMVDAVSWAVRYLLEPHTVVRPKGFQLGRPGRVEVSSYV